MKREEGKRFGRDGFRRLQERTPVYFAWTPTWNKLGLVINWGGFIIIVGGGGTCKLVRISSGIKVETIKTI